MISRSPSPGCLASTFLPDLAVSQLDQQDPDIIRDCKQQAAKIFGLFGERGIGLEVMDNGALCRTFNILVAEDRAVTAAILLPG